MELTEQEIKQIHVLLASYKASRLKSESYDKDNVLKDTYSRIQTRNTLIEAILLIAKKLPENSKLKITFIKNKKNLMSNRINREVLTEIQNALPVSYYLELVIADIFDRVKEIEKTLPYFTTIDLSEHFFQKPEDNFKMVIFHLHHILKKKNPNHIWPTILEIIFISDEFKKYFCEKSLEKHIQHFNEQIDLKKISDPSSNEYQLKKRLSEQKREWVAQSERFNHSPLILGADS